MTPMQIAAQVFGAFGMAALFMSYQQTQRKKLIGCKLTADVMWVVHYLLLGAIGGAIPNFVGIFRELVFMRRSDSNAKWTRSPLVPGCFIAINFILALLKWETAMNLLPLCASAAFTIALWAKNPKLTRMIGAPVSTAFLIYDLIVGSWIGAVNESVAIISIISSYIRNDLKKKEQ